MAAVTGVLLVLVVLVLLAGLTESGVVLRERARLAGAVDAAALAGCDCWRWRDGPVDDRAFDVDCARSLTTGYLGGNMPAAQLIDLQISPQGRVAVTAQVVVPRFFTAAFGAAPVVIRASSSAARDP